jgi:hypothetical protein
MVPCARSGAAREVLPGRIMLRRATVHALRAAPLRDNVRSVARGLRVLATQQPRRGWR